MRVLVTGGAGYIGAITATEMARAGHEVVVFDHFDTHPQEKTKALKTIVGDIDHAEEIEKALVDVKPDLVMHFAAYIQMAESMVNPRKYYENNVRGSRLLVEAMIRCDIKKLVFASTAGVYGNPIHVPILESDPCSPENPYGDTKLGIERLLKWYGVAYGIRFISLRFFNAAGATLDATLGEDHQNESHLIPNVIHAQLENREFTLYGNDYPTPDGTCVRDYIHVLDLAKAFELSAAKLMQGAPSNVYNVGTGKGYSNKEVIAMIEKVSGKPVKIKYEPRRPGDANELVADVTRIKAELGWTPQYSDLETIVKTAYAYHTKK